MWLWNNNQLGLGHIPVCDVGHLTRGKFFQRFFSENRNNNDSGGILILMRLCYRRYPHGGANNSRITQKAGYSKLLVTSLGLFFNMFRLSCQKLQWQAAKINMHDRNNIYISCWHLFRSDCKSQHNLALILSYIHSKRKLKNKHE